MTDPLPEPDQDRHVYEEHDPDDVAMSSFDGAFRALVHASHTTLAAVGPEGPLIDRDDCFDGTVFLTESAIITGFVGIK